MPEAPNNPSEFLYHLPEDRIAKFPVSPRDSSKLLAYRQGAIAHHTFKDLPDFLGGNDLLVFNNTKVVPARLLFQKESGGIIEVFLLSPVLPTSSVAAAMWTKSNCCWQCAIGKLKRWKDGQALTASIEINGEIAQLTAELIDREKGLVVFRWSPENLPFVDLISAAGEVPLPPYLKRSAEKEDKETYQTVYSKKEGAVAAPTAGLHFTPQILTQLTEQRVATTELTLHVSAGTFRPIKTADYREHDMHSEQMFVKPENLEALLKGKCVGAVGTTSLRTLESLYWYGVKLLENGSGQSFKIEKLFPYKHRTQPLPSKEAAFIRILEEMRSRKIAHLEGETEIYIFPGYEFRVVDFLITNFHQPGSTLILLIAAFIGDKWREVYQEALENGYRFLSYGDSSILEKN